MKRFVLSVLLALLVPFVASGQEGNNAKKGRLRLLTPQRCRRSLKRWKTIA
jgi:hypothetical protein